MQKNVDLGKIGSNTVLVVAGPTASGKSALAIDLALKYNGVIINADASQLYKDIPIVSAAPSENDKAKVFGAILTALSEGRDIIINEKSGSNILRYIIAYLNNKVIRDQLAERKNNRLSNLYLKNEAIPFDEMPYASSLCGHNISKARLHKCLEVYECEHQYVSSMVNKEAYDSNTLYVTVDEDKLDYYQYEVDIFNRKLYDSKKQQGF